MNKLFTKIATAFVGIAMAVGVGVAVGNNANFVKADAANIPTESTPESLDFDGNIFSSVGSGQNVSAIGNWSTTNFKLTIAQPSGNEPKYYNNGTAVRVYNGNTVKVESLSTKTIGKIVFTTNSNTLITVSSVSAGSYSDGEWTTSSGEVTEVTFNVNATTRFSDVAIYAAVVSDDPTVSVSGTAGPFYTSTASITLTASPSKITPTSYEWEITSGASYVTAGAANASTFVLTPKAAGTVSGTLTVSDGNDSLDCEWSITIQALAVTAINWSSTNMRWLTNTSFNNSDFGTISISYNDGTSNNVTADDNNLSVYAKEANDNSYSELANKQFTSAGTYSLKLRYLGFESSAKTNFKVVSNAGTVAEAKQYVSGLSNNQYFTGTFTISSGVINTAANSSGHLYLGDTYNGNNDIYLYTCSDYGPATTYGNLTKGACISASGKLMYYNKAELANYTVLSYYKYNGLSVKTAPTKTTYYEGEVFDPAGTVLTVQYSNNTSKDINSGFTYDLTGQLTGTGTKTVTFTYIENGITKTCTQTITVSANPYTLTISNNALSMSEYSENTSITLTPAVAFGNDYVWEEVATSDSDVAVGEIGENDAVTITSGSHGTATLTFEVYTSDLQHSASVNLTVTVLSGSVTLSENSISVDVHGTAKEINVTLSNFESIPAISFEGTNNSYFTIVASNVTKTSAKLTVTAVAVHAATNVTVNANTSDGYQNGSATLSITIVDTALTVSLSGTEVTGFSKGGVPTNWTATGNKTHANNYTRFETAGNYFEHDLLIPSAVGDEIYAVIAQVYSTAGSTTATNYNTITVAGLKDGAAIAGSTATFNTVTGTIGNETDYNSIMTDDNSRWAMVYGTGLNGIKFELTTRKANWVVGKVNLFYLTKAEYDFAVALGDAAMASICAAGESRTTPSDDLSSLWTTLKTNYSSLSTALSSYAYATSGTKKDNHILDKALIRYNYICDKYSTLENFLQRTIVPTSGSAVAFNLPAETNTVATFIAIIAVVSTLSVGGFFFIRKKKNVK